jgi:hypothetical protein
MRYGFDERLRLSREQLVTLRWHDPAGEARDAFGRLDRVAGGSAWLWDPNGERVRVPVDTIWDVSTGLSTARAG